MRLVHHVVVSRRWVPLCNPRAGRFFPLSSPFRKCTRASMCVGGFIRAARGARAVLDTHDTQDDLDEIESTHASSR